MILYAYL
jgi:hypothetical protein